MDFPIKDKYFFEIKSVNWFVPCPVTLRSLATKGYVACDENGKAIMKELETSADIRDRRLWFGLHDYGQGSELKEPVQTKQQDQLDGVYTNQEKVVQNGE